MQKERPELLESTEQSILQSKRKKELEFNEERYPLTGWLNESLNKGLDAPKMETSLNTFNKSKERQKQKQEKRKSKILY